MQRLISRVIASGLSFDSSLMAEAARIITDYIDEDALGQSELINDEIVLGGLLDPSDPRLVDMANKFKEGNERYRFLADHWQINKHPVTAQQLANALTAIAHLSGTLQPDPHGTLKHRLSELIRAVERALDDTAR